MYTAEKRRVRDAEKRRERLEFKFITEYVRALHSDIYGKAKELFHNIRQKYPDRVRDLTKTYEFMSMVTPDKDVPRYYMSRRTKETTITSKMMVLEIPLMTPQDVPVSSPPQASPHPLPPQASPHPLPPQASPHPLPPQASPHPLSPQASPHPPTPQTLPPTTLSLPPPLSEEVYIQLLQDLQCDPDLARILNDFPLHHEDECMTDDIWDSIQTLEVSPLEQELSNIL